MDRGALGILSVTGDPTPAIFRSHNPGAPAGSGH
jgi:hypothetical protein